MPIGGEKMKYKGGNDVLSYPSFLCRKLAVNIKSPMLICFQKMKNAIFSEFFVRKTHASGQSAKIYYS